MTGRSANRWSTIWLFTVLGFLYVPMLSVVLGSLANTRYMQFPHEVWTLDAYRNALADYTTGMLHSTSFLIAGTVVLLAALVGTAGALAFALYDWRGRRLYQRFLLLPVFFPQPVLGLALLLTLTAAGITPTWKTAAFAHLVWVVPIVTLIISIRLYDYDPRQEEAAVDLGASRWQVFRYITWPVIAPGVVSGSNLSLSIFTTGADTTLPEWLFARIATNYSPLVPAVAVIATLVSALVIGVIALLSIVLRRR